MAYETLQRNLKHGTITISDGATTPLTCAIHADSGDLTATIPQPVYQQIQRGDITAAGSHPLPGPDEPISLSFTNVMTNFVTASSDYTPWDMLTDDHRTSSSRFTSVGAAGEKYQVKIAFAIANPNAAGNSETVTFNYAFLEGSIDFAEGEPNTITVNMLDWERYPTITSA